MLNACMVVFALRLSVFINLVSKNCVSTIGHLQHSVVIHLMIGISLSVAGTLLPAKKSKFINCLFWGSGHAS